MRFLDGHKKDVRDAAFLPDGRLVSVGADRTARLWDLVHGSSQIFHRGRGPVYALAVAPDGRTVAVSGRHNGPGTPVTVYDPTAERVAATVTWTVEDVVWRGTGFAFTRHEEPVARAVWSLSFSADGRWLAAAGRRPGGGNIPNGGGGYVWQLGVGGHHSPLPHTDAYAVRFAPFGNVLAVTARGRVVFHAGPVADDVPLVYPIQCDWAPAVAFLPADDRAAIAAGSFVHLVDPLGRRKAVKVKSGSRIVTALAPTPDGRTLLVGGKPGRIEVFDLADGTMARRAAFDFDLGGVNGLAVAPDGLTFAAAGDQGLAVCDLEAG